LSQIASSEVNIWAIVSGRTTPRLAPATARHNEPCLR
jgi:hypothetical protein